MRAEDMKEILTGQPFTPIRIYLSDGKTYDITHPDQVYVMKSRMIIGTKSDPETRIVERSEQIALVHVVRVEPLSSMASHP